MYRQNIIGSRSEVLRTHLYNGNFPTSPPLRWMGRTEDAVPTELFLYGQDNFRLEIPHNSVYSVKWIGTAFNVTDGVGLVHGNHAAVDGSFVCRRADTAFELVGAAIGAEFIFTADDVIDQMKCTVTGLAGKTILWDCQVYAVSGSGNIITSSNWTGSYEGVDNEYDTIYP